MERSGYGSVAIRWQKDWEPHTWVLLTLSLQCRIHRIINKLAEREGFEPSVPRKEDNGFRDRPDRPLRHLSIRTAAGLSTGRRRTSSERNQREARAGLLRRGKTTDNPAQGKVWSPSNRRGEGDERFVPRDAPISGDRT